MTKDTTLITKGMPVIAEAIQARLAEAESHGYLDVEKEESFADSPLLRAHFDWCKAHKRTWAILVRNHHEKGFDHLRLAVDTKGTVIERDIKRAARRLLMADSGPRSRVTIGDVIIASTRVPTDRSLYLLQQILALLEPDHPFPVVFDCNVRAEPDKLLSIPLPVVLDRPDEDGEILPKRVFDKALADYSGPITLKLPDDMTEEQKHELRRQFHEMTGEEVTP